MNYLGHILLSGDDEQIITGNFIGDYVKGKSFQEYPERIQEGILLHRAIDDFTDNNMHWKCIRELLKPVYKRYAGVAADLFIDHVLARNWECFSDTRLDRFSKWTYAALLHNYSFLPIRVQGFLPYLIQHRRFQSYASTEGIEMSLRIMSLRTTLPDCTEKAIKLLINEYETIEAFGLDFLKEVKAYVQSRVQIVH
jgi:acyl carrier protein phosphodiesterase